MTLESLLDELSTLASELETDVKLAQHRQEHVRLSARANRLALLTAHLRSDGLIPPNRPVSPENAP